MAEPAVSVIIRGAGSPLARRRIVDDVVSIATRPSFSPLDAERLDRFSRASVPTPLRFGGAGVKRPKASAGRNLIRREFLTPSTRAMYDRLGEAEQDRKSVV